MHKRADGVVTIHAQHMHLDFDSFGLVEIKYYVGSLVLCWTRYTPSLRSWNVSLVLWCSGYHVCFTRRRSRVRTSPEPLLFMFLIWGIAFRPLFTDTVSRLFKLFSVPPYVQFQMESCTNYRGYSETFTKSTEI